MKLGKAAKDKIILVADPDREVLRGLGNALHEQGYDVRAALDGSKALEKAILVHPELILFDEECPLIPAKKFVQILRSNPRTENIPVIVMISEGTDENTIWGYREAFIRKPFNNDEFLSLVASTFRKMDTADQVREEGQKIEGSLSQISLADLLQIFGINHKTGLLEMKSEEQQARIYIREGSVVHASIGRHNGEKALFRLLEWDSGNFGFISDQVTADINIRRSTDILLLDGARQIDELERLRTDLPGPQMRLKPVPELKGRYEGLHPVTQEIMNLLEFYNTVGELVEYSRVSDYDACRAIRTLLDKGVLQLADEVVAEEEDEEPLLEHDRLYELKVKLSQRIQSKSRITRAKVCIVCPVEGFLKEFIGGIRKIQGMELGGQIEALRLGFGRIGTLHLSENFLLDWMLLPAQAALRPLWQPLGVGMVGGIVMHSSQDDQVLYRLSLLAQELSQKTGTPVLQFSPKNLIGDADPKSQDGTPQFSPAKVRNTVIQLLNQLGSQD
ncbi:MAG: DUF4388 domain-containing protein [Deltaproteobacteria bacterium]|nr:DUF4388 domain-containing protein [Deltaproteobacteria bacterium]